MSSNPATVSVRVFASHAAPVTAESAITNYLTVLGDYVPNDGVPCFECVNGGNGDTIGLVTPDGNIHADGTTQYVFNNVSYDNSYTGNCTYPFL